MFLSSSKQKPESEVEQIGVLLRQSREVHSENLDDIAAYLRIDPAILNALEEGRVQDLPGWARAIGALRSYAEYLDLDASPLVVRYRKIMAEPAGYSAKPVRQRDLEPVKQKPAPRPETEPPSKAPPPMRKHKTPRGLVFAITVFLGIAVFSAIYLSSSPAPDTNIQPVSQQLKAMLDRTIGATGGGKSSNGEGVEVKVRTQTKPLPGLGGAQTGELQNTSAKAKATPSDTPATQPDTSVPGNSVKVSPVDRFTQARGGASKRITLRASEPVWVRIADASGKSVLTREMKTGEMYLVPDEKGLVLEVRNAGALDYFLNGDLVGKLGKAGEAISGFELDNSIGEKAGAN